VLAPRLCDYPQATSDHPSPLECVFQFRDPGPSVDEKMAGVSVLSGDVARTWLIEEGGKTHEVQLFHNTMSGSRSLFINGVEEPTMAGAATMFTASHQVPFTLEGKSGLIRITCDKKLFHYACELHGISQVEENDKLVNVTSGSSIDVTIPTTAISIPSTGEVCYHESHPPNCPSLYAIVVCVLWVRLRLCGTLYALCGRRMDV